VLQSQGKKPMARRERMRDRYLACWNIVGDLHRSVAGIT
jgi:hypothetical protein